MQRKVIVEPFFNDEHVNDGKDNVFVFGILSKEVLVDLLKGLLELLDGEIGGKRELFDKIGNIGGVIIHWVSKKIQTLYKGQYKRSD